jgi:hypothetical protein
MQFLTVCTNMRGVLNMKSIAKFLLVGAVAVTAIALTAAPSEAAKKKKVSATCTPTTLCAATCATGTCRVNICGGDGKWYQAWITPVCFEPGCPAKC